MKIEGFGNKINHNNSESINHLGTRVTSNSFRKTVGIVSGDKNNVVSDSGFNMDIGSN